jgi:TPR repeat protein
MICERGVGVPRDVAAALNWYRQSATNGFAEAGVTLGNYYSDGLEVKPDYVEAFVWYGVAAAQGNQLAVAFRNSMQRKLDAGQLAEAENRVAAVLAHRPPASKVSEPASSGKDN